MLVHSSTTTIVVLLFLKKIHRTIYCGSKSKPIRLFVTTTKGDSLPQKGWASMIKIGTENLKGLGVLVDTSIDVDVTRYDSRYEVKSIIIDIIKTILEGSNPDCKYAG